MASVAGSSDTHQAATNNSIRWSWQSYPANRIDGTRMVVPLGCLFAPLNAQGVPELPYEPLRCVCGGILNSLCAVDFRSLTWGCVLCNNKNAFPAHYAQLSEQSLPAELHRSYDTVEYVLPTNRGAATYVFVIDTCVDTEQELEGLREYVLMALNKMPESCNVALITYGATVRIHDLSGATEYPRSIVLRGNAVATVDQLKAQLKQISNYVCPLNVAEFAITSFIEELQQDVWPVLKDQRPLRCTGAAIGAAASLLEIVAPNVGSSILAFLSGVCTEGPGAVVETSRDKMIRGHNDLRDSTPTARFWDGACAFYDDLMHRIVKHGHALNVFSACLDQTGVAEMKICIQAAGGIILASDSWRKSNFRTSLNRFFKRRADGNLEAGFNCTLDVITSPSWKVMGVVGPCTGTGRKSSSVADSEIGMGGTCQWTTCMLDSSTTFAVYFETSATPPDASQLRREPYRYVQFITKFEVGNQNRIRVTTLKHHVQEKTSFPDLANGFDQEAAVVLLARQAIHKTDTTPLFDVLRWLDRTVVRLVSRFGTYTKDQPTSLKLSQTFVYFPAFVYHLRRSAYLQVFNSSPDETAILRLLLLKSNCNEAIIMIQPTLYSYTMQAPPQPVPLDSSAIKPDNVLLLDTFFEILIHQGESIAAWVKSGYDQKEEYAYFKQFLQYPRDDAAALALNRYPAPRMIEVAKNEPDSRILYNRINPSRSHSSAADGQQYGNNADELVYTDDAPLSVFMDHLKKLAVQQ